MPLSRAAGHESDPVGYIVAEIVATVDPTEHPRNTYLPVRSTSRCIGGAPSQWPPEPRGATVGLKCSACPSVAAGLRSARSGPLATKVLSLRCRSRAVQNRCVHAIVEYPIGADLLIAHPAPSRRQGVVTGVKGNLNPSVGSYPGT